LRICTGCKIARYCSMDCLRVHWKAEVHGHKESCRGVFDPEVSIDCNTKRVRKQKKAYAEKAVADAIKARLVYLGGPRFNRAGLAPSGECKVIECPESGPVRIYADLADGSSGILSFRDTRCPRPVRITVGVDNDGNASQADWYEKEFISQADCFRWLHSAKMDIRPYVHGVITDEDVNLHPY
jgi:hypothetical protein